MWRPEGWEEDRFHRCMDLTDGGGAYKDIYEVFEAGADAGIKAVVEWLGKEMATAPLGMRIARFEKCLEILRREVKE